MGEDECGASDVADFAGAGGDVLEGAPAAGEQGEPAFPETAAISTAFSMSGVL